MSGEHPSAASGVFHRPFTEQVAFFRRKLGNLVPTERWDDLLGEAHDDAFMVAGATEADLLTDLGAAVDKAITEGRGIEDFRRDFRDIVRRNGWTGWTGEGSLKGEAWRVGVIFRTNAYTSYSAGRLAQLEQGKFPFWVYRHGGSMEPRPQHLGWDGLVLPAGKAHPFWARYYPPSAWGCSCYVVGARTLQAAYRRLGGNPDKKLPDDWDTPDPRTGRLKGIGKGWDYAPGASVSETVQAMAGKIGSWDYQIVKGFMDAVPARRADGLADAYRALPSTADDARRYAQRVFEPNPDLPDLPPLRTLGLVRSDQAERIEQLTGIPAQGYDFSFDVSAVGHVIRRHGDEAVEARQGQRAVTAADFARLPQILSRPDSLTLAGESTIGEQVVELTRRFGSETYVARFAVRGARRRTLALKTMFVRVGK